MPVLKVNNLESLLLIPRNDVMFTLSEKELMDNSLFPFALFFSEMTQSWGIEIAQPEKILCNMDYYFDILAKRRDNFEQGWDMKFLKKIRIKQSLKINRNLTLSCFLWKRSSLESIFLIEIINSMKSYLLIPCIKFGSHV